MNKYVWIVLIWAVSGQWAVAGLGIGAARTAGRSLTATSPLSSVRALIKQEHLGHVTSTSILRKTLAVSRSNFTGPHSLLKDTRRSVVQISLPNYSSTLGTGFVLKERGRLWVAMPFHLGGVAGSTRVVRLRKADGSIVQREVKIAINGTAGWHSPDVSLAPLPRSLYHEVEPLEIAEVDRTQDVYSVGYIASKLKMDEVLPVASHFTHVDRQSMLRQFHIPGSTMKNPVAGNGYCGTPLFQKIDGVWKVVGMHNGHVLDLENPSASVGSSVNLAQTIPQMIDNYFHPMAINRGLEFRGWEITRLGEFERVDSITVIPADKMKEPIVRSIRNFPFPYLDGYVEQAVADLDLQRGDKLIFSIKARTQRHKHMHREVEFIIP